MLLDAACSLSRLGVKMSRTVIFSGQQVVQAMVCVSVFAGRRDRLRLPTVDAGCSLHERGARLNVESSGHRPARSSTSSRMSYYGTADVLQKLPGAGTKKPDELSLGAVQAFRDDALKAGSPGAGANRGGSLSRRAVRPNVAATLPASSTSPQQLCQFRRAAETLGRVPAH